MLNLSPQLTKQGRTVRIVACAVAALCSLLLSSCVLPQAIPVGPIGPPRLLPSDPEALNLRLVRLATCNQESLSEKFVDVTCHDCTHSVDAGYASTKCGYFVQYRTVNWYDGGNYPTALASYASAHVPGPWENYVEQFTTLLNTKEKCEKALVQQKVYGASSVIPIAQLIMQGVWDGGCHITVIYPPAPGASGTLVTPAADGETLRIESRVRWGDTWMPVRNSFATLVWYQGVSAY